MAMVTTVVQSSTSEVLRYLFRLNATEGSASKADVIGYRVGGKTGTAQKQTERGMINFAWLIAFAPVEDPRIAIAVAIEGDTPGEETGGGRYASPVAHAILQASGHKLYFLPKSFSK